MAKVSRDDAGVNARIVYWGIDGAGKTTNLRAAFAKLRPDHRGELQEVPTPLDSTVTYELLPITLGEIAGVATRLEMVTAPGGPEQAPTRMQLLDQVDGVVLVVDAQGDKVDANIASFDELRQALASYGRRLEDVPLVVQYNKRDLGDPYAVEELHRKLDAGSAPVFEAVATEGTGVLETLSTISKRVIRVLREQEVGVEGPPAPAAAEPMPTPAERMEEAIVAEEKSTPEALEGAHAAHEAETLLDAPWPEPPVDDRSAPRLGPDLVIVSVGKATRADERSVRVPLVLGDSEGRTSNLVLTVTLDPFLDENSG